MENNKARLFMLALSGLLFGASGFGWYMHTTSVSTAQTFSSTPTTISTPPVITAAANIGATAAAQPAPLEPATPLTYTATTREEAVRAARESVRPDGFAPLTAANVEPPVVRPRHDVIVPPPPDTRLVNPPAVNDPSLFAPQQYQHQEVAVEEPRHDKLTVDDFRLVGLIDGKAIFKIRKHVAQELGLAPAFTLGKGEQFNNIKVDKVEGEHATVRDGTSVATKELGSIH
jgi:hypothetical protein